MAAAAVKSFEKLAAEFRQRSFSSVYLLHGEEDFFLDEAQRLLVAQALQAHERDFNLDVFFGPEADARQVLAACASYPMMAERRVVVVTAFEQLVDNHLFKEYAARPNPSAVVLLLCNARVNLSTHPYRALKEAGAAVEFTRVYDNQLPEWVRLRARDLGLEISPEAAQLLAHEAGVDLRTVDSELHKLHAYVGARSEVDEGDVLAITGQQREYNVFELQRAIGEGDRARAMRIASRMVEQASNRTGEALKLVASLSWFAQRVRSLAAIQARRPSDAEIGRHIGVRPFFVKEYRAAAQRYRWQGAQQALEALLAADFELKGGSEREPGLIVQLMLRRWMQPDRRVGTVVEHRVGPSH